MTDRPYDVVLYGASGFTGKQAAQYFARHVPQGALRWAIAGRNREKLEAVKAALGNTTTDIDVQVADSRDQAAVDALVAGTRVLLNTAGPFALYGDTIVAACVRSRTHYVDISGETPWIRSLIDRYHAQAAAEGTRIIPCCGFDSVPSDLGTYLVVRHLQATLGVPCRWVKAYFQLYGGFNGGTLASVFNLYDSGQADQLQDPFLLTPGIEYSAEEKVRHQDPALPFYDAEIDGWVGPFFMGPVNTRVVRRSQALFEHWRQSYGPAFSYQEYLKFEPPLAMVKATGMTATMALLQGLMPLSPARQVLKKLLPQPGSGPAEKTLESGWFRCELIGQADDGRRVRGSLAARGDPGNRATVKFLCESALCLALNADELPGGPQRGGLLTPATGLGDRLAQRLQAAGMQIEIGG
ncbi:MAG: saccharopine dehydrogenase NADP-binding domain-containing protein [Candidatus Competibacteraceae bacterium]